MIAASLQKKLLARDLRIWRRGLLYTPQGSQPLQCNTDQC